MKNDVKPIPDELIDEAKNNPGGWVYKIHGLYGKGEFIPPESIEGAWKVDDAGQIVGNFIPNPKFVRRVYFTE